VQSQQVTQHTCRVLQGQWMRGPCSGATGAHPVLMVLRLLSAGASPSEPTLLLLSFLLRTMAVAAAASATVSTESGLLGPSGLPPLTGLPLTSTSAGDPAVARYNACSQTRAHWHSCFIMRTCANGWFVLLHLLREQAGLLAAQRG
jgi:hypothetical protein